MILDAGWHASHLDCAGKRSATPKQKSLTNPADEHKSYACGLLRKAPWLFLPAPSAGRTGFGGVATGHAPGAIPAFCRLAPLLPFGGSSAGGKW
jgi:hypothetical protein